MFEGAICHSLDDNHVFWQGQIPDTLDVDDAQFEALWALHPETFHEIKMHGKLINTPRWQQAYGMDYQYTGRVNKALTIPPLLAPYLTWMQDNIHPSLNGILLNWYDAKQKHYIGKHRDSTKNMVPGTPITTLSFGESRVFRLRPWRQKGFQDFQAEHGTVFVMPYETNLAWTHEVPHNKQCTDRRISITFRAFEK